MKEKEICDIFQYDEKKVKSVKKQLHEVEGLSQMFKALADETRLKVIFALMKSELCVCDVATIIDSSTAATSHHLRMLKKHGLAKSRKAGKMVFYTIDDDHVIEILQQAIAHNKEKK
ncbi:metalloregulator ArsR/SmtB family transcription factor [Bacillaceae bacterium IKA-2]|nr:metalloregulator ArsR/SmtB family transcription factor [Bacillaceae bacterium IKA-2]